MMFAIRKAFFLSMRVQSADEAFELLMYSSRAVSDIIRAIDFLHKSPWNLKLIIRDFVVMPIEFELRGFVYKKSFNALSQYYVDCYFEELKQRKDEIANKVKLFYEEVQPKIVLESFIIDFVMLEDGTIKIVELNPYSKSTGSCLFDWIKDKEILENGPFDFRILEEPQQKKVANYLMPWNHLIQQSKDQIKEEDSICTIC